MLLAVPVARHLLMAVPAVGALVVSFISHHLTSPIMALRISSMEAQPAQHKIRVQQAVVAVDMQQTVAKAHPMVVLRVLVQTVEFLNNSQTTLHNYFKGLRKWIHCSVRLLCLQVILPHVDGRSVMVNS